MAFQLCASCRHSFPASGLAKAAFPEEVGERFKSVHTLLDDVTAVSASLTSGNKNSNISAQNRMTHFRQEMEVALQDLCACVHEEVAALRRQIAFAEEQRASRERDLETANAKVAALASRQEGVSVAGGGARGGKLSGLTTAPGPRQLPPPTFNGAVADYQQKKMTTAFELVSASVYSVLESLAIETRADTALLWIRPHGGVALELVAPFVVGRDLADLRTSAPYRVAETSLPAAVAATGTAVNVRPVVGVRDPRPTQEINMLHLIDTCNVAQLLVPVFERYATTTTTTTATAAHSGGSGGGGVMAVVHLIGSPRCPFPFNRRNEDASMHAAVFLSSMMSTHYPVMAGEWANRFYQPSTLHSTGTFQGRLDLRADEKGIDDFTPSPLLVYRCDKDLSGPTDPREAYLALRSAMARSATPSQPVLARVRDLHRHATTMEANWMSAVDANTRLEHRIGVLDDEALRDEVRQLREARDAREAAAAAFGSLDGKDGSAAASARAASAAPKALAPATSRATARTGSLTSVDGNVPLAPAVSLTQMDKAAKSEPVLKPEEVDHLEAVALKRLENLGVDTAAFRSAKDT